MMPPKPQRTPMGDKMRTAFFGLNADIPRISELDLTKIEPNPDQPRKFFDEESLKELAASIDAQGLLQPILVKAGEDDRYTVVAGERRYRAHKLLNRSTILAIITTGNTDEIALVENVQRENLRPLEEAEALQRLIDMHGYTHEEVAKVVGKARNTVTALLSILTLPEDIRESARASENVSKTFLIELASMKGDAQHEAWESMKAGRASTRSARAIKSGTREPESSYTKALRALKICTKSVHAARFSDLTEAERAALISAKMELDAEIQKLTR